MDSPGPNPQIKTMADRRRGKQKKSQEENEKPTKEEYAVAKYLRFSVPPREGKLFGISVQCFIASKAVDTLLDSKWATAKAGSDALFTTRASCVDYCHRLLEKKIFHRAAKVEKKKDKDKDKKKKKPREGEVEEKEEVEKKVKKEKKPKKSKDEEGEKDDKGDKVKESPKDDGKKDEDKKKRKDKKLRLEMHNNQIFTDGDEVYVWIYDPVPVKTFVIGLLLVLGAIGVCLFPLWPPEVRLGVYYLSMAAASFVGLILSLSVVRLVLFCVVWGLSFGRHHFWFLPNLTEDVGFFDSFKPLYKHDFFPKCEDSSAGDDKDGEGEGGEGDKEGNGKDDDSAETAEVQVTSDQVGEEKSEVPEEVEGTQGQDIEGEGSENGSDGNGYEIVDAEDIEDAEKEMQMDSDETPGTKN